MKTQKAGHDAFPATLTTAASLRKTQAKETGQVEPQAPLSVPLAVTKPDSFLERHPKLADALGAVFTLGLYGAPVLAGTIAVFGSGVARGVSVAVLGAMGVVGAMIGSADRPDKTSNDPSSLWM